MQNVQIEPLEFGSPAEWEAWLAQHHERQEGAWLKIARKGSGRTLLSIQQAAEVALCYGWIDSQRKSCDPSCFLQRYSPRRPRAPWSLINVEKAEALLAAGRMQAPGLAEIESARADGRWAAAYESQKTAGIPDDLAAALEQHEQAGQAFRRLNKSEQYAVVLPLLKARTAAARAARLKKAMDRLEGDGEAVHE